MTLLAIETSCDDTGIAILQVGNKTFPPTTVELKANLVSSQVEVHQKWGGVVPRLAKREHQKNLVPVLQKALQKAGIDQQQKQFKQEKFKKVKQILQREEKLSTDLEEFLQQTEKPKIEAIAVTVGPGLPPALWTGVNLARALSYYWNLPLIPVNHLEGHIFAHWLHPEQLPNQPFPAVFTLVSGGHTQIVLVKNIGQYQVLGETRDDAAGECFDKTARLLGLNYPGGPEIAQQARKWQKLSSSQKEKQPQAIQEIKFPRPMIEADNYDFSFAGLKTAVLYSHRKQTKSIKEHQYYVPKMAYEIQKAIIDVIIKKTLRAAKDKAVENIFLSGGVAANQELRRQFKQYSQKQGLNFFVPEPEFCTDNAAMIGLAGAYQYKQHNTASWSELEVNSNLQL